MGRRIRLELGELGEQVVDDQGQPWAVELEREDGEPPTAVTLVEVALWDLAIEGVALCVAAGEDPATAAAEALREAGISSLPEAVAVRCSRHGAEVGAGQAVMVFTLGGQAYQLDHARFNQEIAGSTRWTAARQKNERQINALRDELKKIVEQPQA